MLFAILFFKWELEIKGDDFWILSHPAIFLVNAYSNPNAGGKVKHAKHSENIDADIDYVDDHVIPIGANLIYPFVKSTQLRRDARNVKGF